MPNKRESNVEALSRPRRVLVVDDQRDAATLIAMVLTEEGYEVKVAHDGLAAVALAVEFNPHIALLDLSLPKIDGYQLAVLIHTEPALRDCRLIAMSGYCSERDRERSFAAGFDLHLAKPLSLDGLLLAILPPGRADAILAG